jgi:hypothetical protein
MEASNKRVSTGRSDISDQTVIHELIVFTYGKLCNVLARNKKNECKGEAMQCIPKRVEGVSNRPTGAIIVPWKCFYC